MDASTPTNNNDLSNTVSRVLSGNPDRIAPIASPASASSRAVVPPRRPVPKTSNSSIRIRRLNSNTSSLRRPGTSESSDNESNDGRRSSGDSPVASRRRSLSAPQRMTYLSVPDNNTMAHSTTNDSHMPIIEERAGGSTDATPSAEQTITLQAPSQPQQTTNLPTGRPRGLTDLHNATSSVHAVVGTGTAARANRGLGRIRSNTVRSRIEPRLDDEYDEDVLGLLDLVDPEVQTLGTLTNVQNSLFIPDLGRLINRRPTYDLTSRPQTAGTTTSARAGTLRSRAGTASTLDRPTPIQEDEPKEGMPGLGRTASISSQMTDRHFAVLPHGERLEGWTDDDIAELNDHVRHALHSKRAGFKRSWAGFKKYISKPLGLFVFIYALLVTIGGATWVFFLIGWVYVGDGDRQTYATNVVDNILVALFALIGDGMAPFRAVDTYHMCFIAHYHHLTWRLREKKNLPELPDHNDLPARISSTEDRDTEAGAETTDDLIDKGEFSVLSPIQQRRLQYHQAKFSKSHTFYRPHETSTHHAFPLRLLVAVVVLLDCHSLFQVALGTCTWSINYQVRPIALTTTILSCSITCNIVAGVLVSIGDKRTRKKDVLDKIFRQNLTAQAIEKIQRRHTDERLQHVDLSAVREEEEGDSSANSHKGRISRDFARITNTAPRKSKEFHRASKDLSRSHPATIGGTDHNES